MSSLLWAVMAAASVDVHSATECPSSADIAARLAPLLPAQRPHDGSADRAEVEPAPTTVQPDAFRLRLVGVDGHIIGDRHVVAQGACPERAEAVAAILAAWESAPATAGATNAPPVATVAITPTVAPVPVARRRIDLAVGAGGGVALIGGVAATGSLELIGGLADRRWQLRLAASGQTTRQLDLGGGTVSWQHTSFSAGLLVRSLGPRWRISADAGPTFGWASLAGEGFSPNRSSRSFEYGGTAGVRVARWRGRFAAWAEARTTAWVNGQRARAGSAAAPITADLPVVDVSASLGLSAVIF